MTRTIRKLSLLAATVGAVGTLSAFAQAGAVVTKLCWIKSSGVRTCSQHISSQGSCGTNCTKIYAELDYRACDSSTDIMDKIETWVSTTSNMANPTFWVYDPYLTPANFSLTVNNGYDSVDFSTKEHIAVHDTSIWRRLNGLTITHAYGYLDLSDNQYKYLWIYTDCRNV
jgi:hypothetical protein